MRVAAEHYSAALLLVSMIQYSDEEVRTVLSQIFISKIKQMLFKE